MSDFEIIIIGNKRKKILTTEYLKDIPHTVFYSTDYDLPIGWKKTSRYANGSEIGAYRAFKAHIDAINSSTCDNVLIFEDDAVPNISNWLEIANKSIKLLDQYDIVSLHGRSFKMPFFKNFIFDNLEFITPQKKPVWIVGMLAYFVNKKILNSLNSIQYDGTPIDIILPNQYTYCCLKQSPFIHDRRYGSLLDGNPKV